MQYTRPDIKAVGEELERLIKEFKDSKSFEVQDSVFGKIIDLRTEFESMEAIASINYSNDTTNKNYMEEQDYFDDNNPVYEEYLHEFYKAITDSEFRKELEEKYGKNLFEIATFKINIIIPEILEDLQKENHLGSKYMKLIASASIKYDGKDLNLQELGAYMQSSDRNVRKESSELYWKFFADNSEELDAIYDELVKTRKDIAVKLGYENFVKVGYQRMQRSGYNENDISRFRDYVKKHIVPLTVKLREQQKHRLELEGLKYYDLKVLHKEGNAAPKGSPEWILENGKKMYSELSAETGEFYDFMLKNDLMDVLIRKGKDTGGFCNFIPKYKSPYIFANMNGTEDDITVLTHEAGHAFQAYSSKHYDLPEYHFPSSEAAEIHSMSMEYLTHPWMDLFFKEETDRFKYTHLIDSVLFIPYGVLVDDFQHWVYENPDSSPSERNSKWIELEKIYLPYYDYDGNEYLEKGGRWQRQAHIYEAPFYYIDYCLAQICAFQFWSKAIHSVAFIGDKGQFQSALKDYIKLCKAGGSKPFLELVKYANLESPFDEEVIKKIMNEIEIYVDSHQDDKL